MVKMTEEQLAYFREKNRKWREANREKAREASKRGHAENRERHKERVAETTTRYRQGKAAKYWFKKLYNSAVKAGRDFDLTEEFLAELLSPMVCSVTGLELLYDWEGPGHTNPLGPSVARVDSSGGYTMDNVRLVCRAYNLAKSDRADEVVLRMALALAEKLDG